jgi:hypothetical protein
MANQMLIYETAVPVSGGRHGKASVEVGNSYAFARNVNSIPLMVVEFPQAADEYAIVFAANGDGVLPVVILGALQNSNLYLDAQDQWGAKYIPAFVRRYPFVFSTTDEGKTFTLCIDEAFQGLNYLGRGRALFGADGKPSEYVEGVLQFLQEYRSQHLRTEAFCKRLSALNLLEPMQAQFTMANGEKMSLTGFSIVSRDRLKALTDEQLGELVRSDEMELLFLHLRSMRNFASLKDRLVNLKAAATPDPTADSPGAEPA